MLYKQLIENNYKRLSPTEKIVGDAILKGEVDVLKDSMTKMSIKLKVSPALISKFCIKIGVSGFKEFKGIVFSSLSASANYSHSDSSSIEQKLGILFNAYNSNKGIIERKINGIANDIKSSNRTIIMANEFTADITKIFAEKLLKLGYTANVFSFNSSYINFKEKDTILFVSISGSQPKIEYYKKFLNNKKKVTLITLGAKGGDDIRTIALSVFNKISLTEKSFPLTTDIFLTFILNQILFILISDDETFKSRFAKTKLKNI